MSYNYHDAVCEDIRKYLRDIECESIHLTRDELEESLNDDLWIEDSVTGNGSGQYASVELSEQYVRQDGFEYVLALISEWCISADTIAKHFLNSDWDWIDVSIRCYLLSGCIAEVLDEMESEGFWDRKPDPVK